MGLVASTLYILPIDFGGTEIRIFPLGRIVKREYIEADVKCGFELVDFPNDKQTCRLIPKSKSGAQVKPSCRFNN